jgi:Chaperone of endosialidase
MCFGNSTTSTQTMTPTPNPAVANAATQNLTAAQNLQTAGFAPYTGQQVAGFSPQQASSFELANMLAAAGVPNVSGINTAIGNAAAVGPQSVTPSTISSAMSPYMNAYVGQALAPQIAAQNAQFAQQDQNLNAQATSSGAFGDARAGIQAANLTQQQNLASQGLIGNAYTSAFNTAIGAGAQDVANSLQAQTTNANLANQYAQQQLGVAGAGEQAGTYQVGTGTNLATLQNTMGQQQTAQQQAQLNAAYNQWLMAQQYPFMTSQNLNQTIGAGATAMPAATTTTVQQPNNAGYGLLGAIVPSLFSSSAGNPSFISSVGSGLSGFFSDIELKENIAEVGRLEDGTPVFSYNMIGDPRTQIGLIAQDVEQRVPEAVSVDPVSGFKVVDYERATRRARGLAATIGDIADAA